MVVVVEVVDDVVVLVGVVVVGALLLPEHAVMEMQRLAIISIFLDIFLISLRCLIELFQNLTFRVLITQH